MSSEAKPESKIDVKKMLGNPKITFVIGKQNAQVPNMDGLLFSCRWTRIWKGNTVCQTRGGVWLHTHFNWRLDARRDEEGKLNRCELLVSLLLTPLDVILKLSPFAQGSREGDRIRKIVTEGGLVPFELTVQVLINALIANPSQVSYENFKYYNLLLNLAL